MQFLLFAIGLLAAAANNSTVSAAGLARDFLDQAVIDLFSKQFQLTLPELTLNVTGLQCTNFAVQNLSLVSTQSHGASFRMIEFRLERARCILDAVALSRDNNGQHVVQLILHLRNAHSNTMLSIDSQIKVLQCSNDFEFDSSSLQLVGFTNYANRKLVEHLYEVLAPMLGHKILDPLICTSVRIATSVLNTVWHAIQQITEHLPLPPQRLFEWPNIPLLERKVHARTGNSSLFAAPYRNSLGFKLASHVVNDLLGSQVKHQQHPILHRELVINKVIKQRLGRTFALNLQAVEFNFQVFKFPIKIRLDELLVTNLSTFKKVNLLVPKSKLTLSHLIEMDKHTPVMLGLRFTVNDDADFLLDGFKLSGFKMDIKTLFAFDDDQIRDVSLEHFLDCGLTSLRAFQLPKLDIDYNKLELPQLTSRSEPELAIWLQSIATDFLLPMLPTKQHVQHLLRVFAWDVSPLVSSLVKHYQHCPAPVRVGENCTSSNYVKWPMFQSMGRMITQVLANPANNEDFSISRIAEIVVQVLSVSHKPKQGYLVRDQTLHLGPSDLLKQFPSLPENSTASAWLGNLSLGPVNGFSQLDLLLSNNVDVTDSSYAMRNVIGMNTNTPFTMEFDVRLEYTGLLESGEAMAPALRFKLSMDRLLVDATSLLQVALPSCLQLKHIWTMDPCAFNVFGSLVNPFQQVAMGFENFKMDITCIGGCKRASTRHFLDHLRSSGDAMQHFMVERAMPKLLQVMSGRDVGYFDGFNVTLGMNRYIADQQLKCAGGKPHHKTNQTPIAPAWIPPMRYFMLFSALFALATFAGYLLMMRRKHFVIQSEQHSRLLISPILRNVLLDFEEEEESGSRVSLPPSSTAAAVAEEEEEEVSTPLNASKDLSTPLLGSDSAGDVESPPPTEENVLRSTSRRSSINSRASSLPRHIDELLRSDSATRKEDALYLLGHHKSLFDHHHLPLFVRWGVLLALFANFVIFVIGNFFTMGEITLKQRVGDEVLRDIPMMSLTLDNCIDMMINAKALLFALFIGGCSGVFPWIRVALLAFAWLAEPTVLPVETRGKLLENMEMLGKFALAEVYLFTILMTVVNIDMQIPGENKDLQKFLLNRAMVADVECVPRWGLFTFLAATWLSLALNHLLVHLHKASCRSDSQLIGYWQLRDKQMSKSSLELSRTSKAIVLVLWPMTLLGAFVFPILKVEFLGYSGFGINLLKNGNADLTVSLGTIFPHMFTSDPAHLINPFGRFMLILGYALFILIAPTLHWSVGLAIHLRRWHPAIKRYHVLNAMRILNVWSTLEVLALTLLVINLQLHKFFKAMSGNITFLPLWIAPVLDMFGASDEQSVGFGVKPELQPVGFAMVCLAIIFARLGHLQLRQALLVQVD